MYMCADGSGSIRPGAPVKLATLGRVGSGSGANGGSSTDNNGMLKIPTRSGGGSIEAGKGFALTAAPWAKAPAQTGITSGVGGVKGGAMGAAPWANKTKPVIDASKAPTTPQAAADKMLHVPHGHDHSSIPSGKGMSLTAAPWAGGGDDKI
jgi:hypothetical protein